MASIDELKQKKNILGGGRLPNGPNHLPGIKTTFDPFVAGVSIGFMLLPEFWSK